MRSGAESEASNWRYHDEVDGPLAPGSYEIECKSVRGWIAPARRTVTVTLGEPIVESAVYGGTAVKAWHNYR